MLLEPSTIPRAQHLFWSPTPYLELSTLLRAKHLSWSQVPYPETERREKQTNNKTCRFRKPSHPTAKTFSSTDPGDKRQTHYLETSTSPSDKHLCRSPAPFRFFPHCLLCYWKTSKLCLQHRYAPLRRPVNTTRPLDQGFPYLIEDDFPTGLPP